MQSFSSHSGISSAMLRFSHCAVAGGIGAVHGHLADGKIVAIAEDHGCQHVLHKGRSLGRHGRTKLDLAGGRGNLDAIKMLEGEIDGSEVLFTTASPRLP
jgi:hypothetical protein